MAKQRDEHGGMFQEFFHSEVSGSVILLVCAIAALAWANSPWSATYFDLEHTPIAISWGEHVFPPAHHQTLGHWIGDGLMVIFFFVVGLEIKREFVVGQLSSLRQAILPVSAALGGMIAPAILYTWLNFGGAGASGWGIPMATDIAFALGILALFGARAPIGLKIFLTALAIADDLGAVVVIAVFYTDHISPIALAAAGGLLFLIFLAGRLGIRATWIYALLMVGVWAAVLLSGVHATVAGVLIAMLIPVQGKIDAEDFLATGEKNLAELEATGLTRDSVFSNHRHAELLDDLYLTTEDMRPAGLSLEHQLHPVQAFLILPLFALFKAGVPLSGETLAAFPSAVSLGIIVGLVLGKPIGVTLFTWVAVKSGQAELPAGVTWFQIVGVSCLAGVGFTMSIFISELAFEDAGLIGEAKIGVLAASVLSGIVGFLVLCKALSAPRR